MIEMMITMEVGTDDSALHQETWKFSAKYNAVLTYVLIDAKAAII
jgi:hypothetical protein